MSSGVRRRRAKQNARPGAVDEILDRHAVSIGERSGINVDLERIRAKLEIGDRGRRRLTVSISDLELVRARAAGHRGIARRAQDVVAVAAEQAVLRGQPADGVIARTAIDLVVRGRSRQNVVAAKPRQHVPARFGAQRIGVLGAHHGIGIGLEEILDPDVA